VVRSEAEGVALTKEFVAATAHVFADEASHWDLLHAHSQPPVC
jgi:hypothetical protein